MSIDLEWDKLDSSLSTKLVEILNRQLSSTSRPSFIGPVEVTSLEFGSTAPDVELVDLRDIYRDFLEDNEEEKDPVKVTEGGDDDDEFEWVSATGSAQGGTAGLTSNPHVTRLGRVPPICTASAPSLRLPGDIFRIKLSVTGLIFTGEIAVAYEGERRRVHLCILDELDPYGPAGDRPKPETDSPKPLPIGQRLLPSIYIESEIGQADKHVLKNVTRVERFIQDVIRKTVEEELVFPNFHTLIMSDP
ncbi:mitochondrial distribution and morphology protein 12 [Desarmillaria tabescens]|uniref:Mitochondrial distribution and morphology protein 12 n=1 Tax=Armillaria tabescens TaxID=1929756 RepID=A0AA39TR46_ARMTA|nr:mitochondrial distribution and morphology protein 12 [Desarmillaria tabescens]KAK0463618.1 mitochondrial distribution and morphology protein 12 [Desarmillaria tabescens]